MRKLSAGERCAQRQLSYERLCLSCALDYLVRSVSDCALQLLWVTPHCNPVCCSTVYRAVVMWIAFDYLVEESDHVARELSY